jgi:hypothetical protein
MGLSERRLSLLLRCYLAIHSNIALSRFERILHDRCVTDVFRASMSLSRRKAMHYKKLRALCLSHL